MNMHPPECGKCPLGRIDSGGWCFNPSPYDKHSCGARFQRIVWNEHVWWIERFQ